MKNIFIKLTSVTVLAVSVISCAGRLEVTPPNSITDEQIEDLLANGTADQKAAILKSIVNPMVSYFNSQDNNNYCSTGSANTISYSYPGIEWARTLMGNDVVSGFDMEPYGLAGGEIYRFQVPFRNINGNTNYCHWAMYAIAINQANSALKYMTEELAATDNLYRDGRARALAVRAYSYMCLMEEYQDAYLLGGKDKLGLSIYTTYDPTQETVARSTSKETWDFIIKDLQNAKSYLTSAGISYTTGRTNAEDIDLGVVNFLLARATLLTGDWATCITACNDIINSNAYSLIKAENYGGRNTGAWTPTSAIKVSPVTNAFTNIGKNPETILGFRVGSSYYNQAAAFFNLAGVFSTYAQLKSVTRIDTRLYDKISDKDCRKDAFHKDAIGEYKFPNGNSGSLPTYANLKFSATDGLSNDGEALNDSTSNTKLDYTKFRLSEVYLMLAEAYCMTNGEGSAKDVINKLLAARAKDGSELTIADYQANGESVLDVVKLQWRIEMWGEGGREWYNNKRWGVPVDRSNSLHVENIQWPANKMTLHIPERELQDNNKCVDNQIIE